MDPPFLKVDKYILLNNNLRKYDNNYIMTDENKNYDNISFLLEDNNDEKYTEFDINIFLQQLGENTIFKQEEIDHLFLPQIINYNENFTSKELLQICDYYGIGKELKSNKCNKEQIIHFLVNFELEPANNEIVIKRKNMWFYINELKSDKFMKKFVLW